ncbi:WASH complex subunit 3 [Drosophila eugracilis]|uniref:WASH complex subunit 3 n=1 Tax=Drosophila eugracilis TaxID=29029 RepID=UPI0007E754F7|nr:WASH complex subunit 3 [Drosophila eugracilis]
MDATSAITADVDKTQIPPLNHKRVLAFVNHFLVSTCTFLNEFALGCETKFVQMERQLQKTEAALLILEAKLASIPTEPHLVDDKPKVSAPTSAPSESNASIPATELPTTEIQSDTEDPPECIGVRASEDARYRKFFKMVHVGVPAPAVKQKMQSEGLEPRILDNPDLILADGIRE